MSCEGRRRGRRNRVSRVPLVALALIAGSACNDESTGPLGGPFRLTFNLDASFQAAHGSHPIAIAIVRPDGSIVIEASGAVSATQNPSFTWSTGPVMQAGISYQVHSWIDSNFGGGTLGVCDPRANDHQWSVELVAVSNDVAITTAHQPALTEDVCATFS